MTIAQGSEFRTVAIKTTEWPVNRREFSPTGERRLAFTMFRMPDGRMVECPGDLGGADARRTREGAAPRGDAVVFLAALAAPPTAASAHGIGGDAADRSVLGFVPLGVEHMLLGWDHLLFIAGVVLIAREVRLAAKLISVFVVGHSTTLIAATLAGWQVNAGLVDAIIALSVAFVGCVGLFNRPESFTWFGGVVLAFGLIHGLGLATRFQALGLPEEGQLWKVIAFNVGIEIGQLAGIIAMVALAWAVLRVVGAARERLVATG